MNPMKLRSWRFAAGLCIAMLAACGGGEPELASSPPLQTKGSLVSAQKVNVSSLNEMPYTADSTNQAGWWSPMAEHGGNTYMAYNAPGSAANNHKIYVAKRTSSGVWSTGCLKQSDGSCAEYSDDIGHNEPSIAIDGDGFIHVFASMHNNYWRYFRSQASQDVSDIRNSYADMPDGTGYYTYPILTKTPNGDVYLIIRVNGTDGRTGRLYKWADSSNTWARVASFAFETGKAVYPDDIKADSNGDLHIIFEWLGFNGGGPIRHMGSYLRYRPSTNTFYTANGTSVAVPVTSSTAGLVYQGLQAGESFANDSSLDAKHIGFQSAKLSIQPSNNAVHIAYRLRSTYDGNFGVKRARFASGNWQIEDVYAGSYSTFAALGVSHNNSIARVYYSKNVNGVGRFYVSEKSSTTSWTETEIANGKDVQRFSVVKRSTNTDVLYLAAPTAGKVYYTTNDY